MIEIEPGKMIIVGESGQEYETTIGADIEAGEADAIEPADPNYTHNLN